MKKILISFLLLILGFLMLVSTSLAQLEITESPRVKIVINGKAQTYDNVPIIVSGRTLLPLRAILTGIGVQNDSQHIIWNEAEKSVTVIKDEKKVYLKIGSPQATVDNILINLDVSPLIYMDRTYIPVRFVSQSFNNKVFWDDSTGTVLISDMKLFLPMEDAIKKSQEATKNQKFKLSNKSTFNFQNSISITSSGFDEEDNTKKIKHGKNQELKHSSDGNTQTVDTEYYNIGDFEYSKVLPQDKWTKKNITDKLKEQEASKENDAEKISTGMTITQESSTQGNLVMDGDIVPTILFEDCKFDPRFMAHSKIVLDKNTYKLLEMSTTASGELTNKSGEKVPYTLTIEALYTYYDDNYEIPIPDDLK